MESKYLLVLFWVLMQTHVTHAVNEENCASLNGTIHDCPDVTVAPNSKISFSRSGNILFAEAECSDGYHLHGDNTQAQCIEGEWLEDLSYYCAPDGCDTFPPIINGEVTIHEDCDGLTATITCNDGFTAEGLTELYCNGSGWFNGAPPTKCISSHAGNHFAVVMMLATFRIDRNVIKDIIITTEESANVSLQSASLFFGSNIYQQITDCEVFSLDPQMTLLAPGISDKAIIINSDNDINVQVFSYRVAGGMVGMDSYFALPTDFCGNNEFYVLAAEATDMIAVIALEDNINVTAFYPGQTVLFSVTLNLYSVYHRFKGSFTGMRVLCDGKCSVIGGTTFVSVPNVFSMASKDTCIVDFVPTSDYYQVCLAGPSYPDSVYILKALAADDNTTVTFVNDEVSEVHYLNRGDYYTYYTSTGMPTLVMANEGKRILVGQYSLTTKYTHRAKSDPSLILCLSPDQYGNNYKFHTVSGFGKKDFCYLRIIIRSAFKDDVRLNDNNINEVASYTMEGPDGFEYSFIYQRIQPNTLYTLSTASCSGEPFSADYYCQRRVGQITTRIGRTIPRCST